MYTNNTISPAPDETRTKRQTQAQPPDPRRSPFPSLPTKIFHHKKSGQPGPSLQINRPLPGPCRVRAGSVPGPCRVLPGPAGSCRVLVWRRHFPTGPGVVLPLAKAPRLSPY